LEVGQVEPPVQGRHALMSKILEKRILQEIDVKMDHVEALGSPSDVVEHHKVTGNMVADASEPQSSRHARNEVC
jgi:hypothetical protein